MMVSLWWVTNPSGKEEEWSHSYGWPTQGEEWPHFNGWPTQVKKNKEWSYFNGWPTQIENDFFVTDDLSILKFEKDFKRGLNIWRPTLFKEIFFCLNIGWPARFEFQKKLSYLEEWSSAGSQIILFFVVPLTWDSVSQRVPKTWNYLPFITPFLPG